MNYGFYLAPQYPLCSDINNSNNTVTVPASSTLLSPCYHYSPPSALFSSGGGFPAALTDDFQYYDPLDHLNPNFSNQQSFHYAMADGCYEEFDPLLYPFLNFADHHHKNPFTSPVSDGFNVTGTEKMEQPPQLLWSTDNHVLFTNGLENETDLIFSQAQQQPLLQICDGNQKVEISVDNNDELKNGRPDRKIRKRSARQVRLYDSSESQNNNSVAESLTWETLSQYFYVPIAQAAKELNIGLTLFKKRCRELGVRRWPHRKLMSIKSLIKNVQEMEKDGGVDPALSKATVRDAIEVLENQRKMMEVMPDIQLEEQTKRLRQACFKANYKKRRLMMMNDNAGSAGSSGSFQCRESTTGSSVNDGTATLDFEDSDELMKSLLFDSLSASECSFLDDCI